jgi:ethanolamine utilization microcompartment shell protein EutS
MSTQKYLVIEDANGGGLILIPGYETAGGVIVLGDAKHSISVSGLNLNTAGVLDTLNKRFVTDAQLVNIDVDALIVAASEQRLATNAGVDLNAAATPTLYTVPAGKTAIVTKIVLKNASISLTTWSGSFGFTGATYNDVIADATHTELTGPTLVTKLQPKIGALQGVAAATLKLKNNTLQGAAATVDIDVFGYLY